MDKYYFITVMEHVGIGNHRNIPYVGDVRTCGFYSDFEEADRVVRNNITDLHEGCYDYAVIEEYVEGIGGYTYRSWWYEYDNARDCYNSMKKPNVAKLFSSFALG